MFSKELFNVSFYLFQIVNFNIVRYQISYSSYYIIDRRLQQEYTFKVNVVFVRK